jgi:hypothetical protein
MEEDVKMLRQVLDNLLAFSLSQEYDGTIQGSQRVLRNKHQIATGLKVAVQAC